MSWFRQGLDLKPPTGFRPRFSMERRFRRYTNAAGQERLVIRLDPFIFPELSETERTFEVEDWVDSVPGSPHRGRLYMLKSMLDGTVSQPIYHASSFAIWDDVPVEPKASPGSCPTVGRQSVRAHRQGVEACTSKSPPQVARP